MIVAILLALTVMVLVIAKLNARARATREAWSAATKDLGLAISPGAATGIAGGALTIHGESGSHTMYVFAGLPWDMAFGGTTSLGGSVTRDFVTIGDPDFDARVKIRGGVEDVVALLDASTRKALVEIVARGGAAGWGKLSLRSFGLERDPDRLVETARSVMALGDHLSQQARKKLLLANVLGDPVAAVRARNISVLAEKFRDSDEAKRAAGTALRDSDPAVRVLAADLERGDRSKRVLSGIVVDARIDAQLRATAFERLVAIFGYASGKGLTAQALEQPEAALRRVAAVAAGEAQDTAQLERLCELAREEQPALSEAVAVALGRLGDPRAEPALIALLARTEDGVRIAAARALGLIGTVRAVEPLLPFTKGLLHGDLHAAARDAVRRIQERLGDPEAGRLSVVADSPAGAVSVADDPGKLSIVKE